MTTATATEVQNNFGKYLQMVQAGGEIIVMKNGKEVARLVSHEKSVSFKTKKSVYLCGDVVVVDDCFFVCKLYGLIMCYFMYIFYV